MARAVTVATRKATTATRVITVTTRRPVSDAGTSLIARSCPVGRLQDVAGSAHGVDHGGPAGVDLLAEVGDVQLDDVRLAAEVVVPHAVEDLCLGEHPAGVAHEEAQQLELRGGEVELLGAPEDLVAVLVQPKVTHREHRRLA